jgi:hypothetical protein
MPCSLVGGYSESGGTRVTTYNTTWCHTTKDHYSHFHIPEDLKLINKIQLFSVFKTHCSITTFTLYIANNAQHVRFEVLMAVKL